MTIYKSDGLAWAAVGRQTPDISVVLPVYRNRGLLKDLHRRLKDVLNGLSLSYELIFVDDACPEASLSELQGIASTDARVAVIALARNVGQHRAVLAGLRFSRAEQVVVMDADLQDPPEAIPELIGRLREGYAAVFAGRRGRYESRMRLLTSRVFKTTLHLLSGVPVDAGLYVAMDRRMVNYLLSFSTRRPFVVAMIGRAGMPLYSTPVLRAKRPASRSAYSSWKRAKTGCLAIAHVIYWRLQPRRAPASIAQPEIKAFVGARFDSETDAAVTKT